MHNQDIRKAAKNAGIFLWQVAERIGMRDSNFSKLLRRELSPQDKAKILGIIQNLAQEKAEVS